uniref:NADH-ubiquinone oxidoreductase chain M n=1 Tax=uncultured Nocardioidaceae bacterium TaxID=253824 RepID=A0A6J4KX67_9ACTN|nr:MAG: NADH-ubiquinone oxidoreductase chain M [uncultured Nocardioidaceae bacterium]
MLLSLALLLPALGALVLVVAGQRCPTKAAAVVGTAASLAPVLPLSLAWASRSPGEAFAAEVDVSWIEALKVHWHLGLDGAGLVLALMSCLLSALCCAWLASSDVDDEMPSTQALVALVLVVTTASLGVFLALDLLVFFVFFELALIPMWFVIAWWGDPHDPDGRRRAATRFLLFTVAGSALMLVGFVGLAATTGTLQLTELAELAPTLSGSLELVLAVAIALGFAVKTPVWPLHIWLPDAHSAAPTVGSVLLAGVFLKLGTFGFVRVLVPVLPEPTSRLAPYLGALGVIAIAHAALVCLRQRDLKRLIAYSSVGHMGFVVLGVATMTDAGLAAAVYASVAHGVVTGLLFFLAGALKDRHGTSELSRLGGGLYGRTPWLAVAFAFTCLASLGLPGLAGFWGELLALRGTYEAGVDGGVLQRATAWTLLAVAAVGIALTTAYFTGLLRRLLQGPAPGGVAGGEVALERDLDVREAAVVGVLAVSVLALGVLPFLLLGPIEQALPWIIGVGR